MAQYTDDLERLFKEGFEGFEHEISDKVWQSVDQELFSTPPPTDSYGKMFALSAMPIAVLLSIAACMPSPAPVAQHAHTPMHEVALAGDSTINVVAQEEELSGEMVAEPIEEEVVTVSTPLQRQVQEVYNDEMDAMEEEQQVQKAKRTVETATKKDMPSLPDQPYFNHDFYKQQGSDTYSRFSINKLHKGVLLVRLKTGNRSIEALEQRGMHKDAAKLKAQIDAENKELMAAFNEKYHFSKVYFFYSDHSDNVRDMNFAGIFVNDQLQSDPSIVLDPSTTFYMILDVGMLRVPEGEGVTTTAAALSRALVIKDRDFDQMYRPFPFFVKAANERQIKAQVERLSNELYAYYFRK